MKIRFFAVLLLVSPAFALVCRPGEVWVKNFIKFECFSNSVRPIGCVPDDKSEGKVIPPGADHRTEHFFFRCVQEGDALAYKIINCVDDKERVVEIGQFFTRAEGDRRVRVECEGNATEAKKTVLQWTSCTLPSGEKLPEGGIHVKYARDASGPQTAEIFACKREGPKVSLKCTGCVSSGGDQVVVSGYATVDGKQMQCRRFDDGCRLINIDTKFLECTLDGENYDNDSFFNSTDGVNYYYCKRGFLEKRGCFLNGEFVPVGDLVYHNDKPLFCGREKGFSSFGKNNGCKLRNGSVIRFKEAFEEDSMMKRCLWTYDGREINGTRIEPYACIDRETQRRVLAEKFLQKGALHTVLKCSRTEDNRLVLRPPTTEEFLQYANSALSYNLLLSEIARGGYGNAEWIDQLPNYPFASEECTDRIPHCNKLKSICESSFSKNVRKLKDSVTSIDNEILNELEASVSSSCDHQLQTLVEIACPKTCGSCLSQSEVEKRIDGIARKKHPQC